MRNDYRPRCKLQIELVLDGRGAPNSRPIYLEVDPLSVNVGLNGYYEADTWDAVIDARRFPVDPDQVAYVAGRVYMWDEHADSGFSEWARDENLMIKGLVDDIDLTLVGDGHEIKLTGRDYTALLLDTEWDPKDSVPAGKSLLDTVQQIADEAAPKGTRARFLVEWQVGKVRAEDVICGGSKRSTKRKGLHVKPGKSYWDVIWDLCVQHATVVRVEGSNIIISDAATETKQTLAAAPKLIHGVHLSRFSIKRKFAREKVPQIVLVAYDPETGERIEVEYPAKRNIDVQVTANPKATDALGIPLTVKKDERLWFPAPDVGLDRETLKRYARLKFYHLGRGDTVYTLSTSDLEAPGGGRIHNLLKLRPGRAIQVDFDPLNEAVLRSLEHGERVRRILEMGYRDDVARVVAANIDRMQMFKQSYYFNRGSVSYDHQDGIEIEIEAANFASEVHEIAFAEAQTP